MITIPEQKRRYRAGFTLLEVMVAMAVLAIALTAVLSSQGRSMFVADVSDFTTTSAHLGAKRLAEFLAEDDPIVSNGHFEDPHRHFFWKFESGKKFGDLDQLPEGAADNLQRLDLQVGDERRDQAFTITRYRFRVDSP